MIPPPAFRRVLKILSLVLQGAVIVLLFQTGPLNGATVLVIISLNIVIALRVIATWPVSSEDA